MKIDLSKVIGFWECPECHFKTECTYTDCVGNGTPFCADCDIDMELQDGIGEYDGPTDGLEAPQDAPESNDFPEEAVEDIVKEIDPEAFERVSIYSCIGTKVKYHKLPYDWENKDDIEKERKYKLEDGKIYTVEHIKIKEDESAEVYLVEIFEVFFNGSRFEEIK